VYGGDVTQRPVLSGKVVSLRLPLAADAELRAQASGSGTSVGRYASRLLTAGLAAKTDRAVTATLTLPGRLYAALLETGLVSVPAVPDDPEPPEPRGVERAVGAIEALADWEPGSEAPADGVDDAPSNGVSRRVRREPTAEELKARGGVGTVPGCEHRRYVPVATFRKCAVCAAVRGVDGVWRVG
jgi:hypothetical protein